MYAHAENRLPGEDASRGRGPNNFRAPFACARVSFSRPNIAIAVAIAKCRTETTRSLAILHSYYQMYLVPAALFMP